MFAPSRREVLSSAGLGCGWLAFAGLAAADAPADPLAPKPPHHPATAKRVIFLTMRGGPSQLDLFDHKPRLAADDGKPGPHPGTKWLGPRARFQRRGQSGTWVSDLLPELATQADKLCLLPGLTTEVPAHPQAFLALHTGSAQFVRPSLGAWMVYGLGTPGRSLPGFVSITPPSGLGGATNYGSAFLPAAYQGTRFGTDGRPVKGAGVPNLTPRVPADRQKAELAFAQELNRGKLARDGVNPAVDGAIAAFELAFRMQAELPAVADLGRESAATLKRYGIGEDRTDDMGRKCLLARRLVEAGVRFVEVAHGDWDHHADIGDRLAGSCAAVDKPIAGLLADLASRGLLADTLVVWAGEFGRTPYAEGTDGRDHHVKGFTGWLAGGGVKAGHTHGRTDEYGLTVEEGAVPVPDFHATLLHLLGLDHERLTFRHAGRDFRLTDVKGRVVEGVIG